MPVIDIVEHKNPVAKDIAIFEENQKSMIPDIKDPNIPQRNGFISLYNGSGGSGKSNLIFDLVTNKDKYLGKFNNIFYICPEASFASVKNHPFSDHDKVFHELTVDLLEEIYQSLIGIVQEREELKEEMKKAKGKNKKPLYVDDEEIRVKLEKVKPVQYHLIIIDDYANELKNHDIQIQLNKMLVKSRHVCLGFIFTLQSYNYFPKTLRKQITNITIFKPKNVEEFILLAHELINMNRKDALTLFNYCFDKPYTHLDIDTWQNKYYKNFNELEFVFDQSK